MVTLIDACLLPLLKVMGYCPHLAAHLVNLVSWVVKGDHSRGVMVAHALHYMDSPSRPVPWFGGLGILGLETGLVNSTFYFLMTRTFELHISRHSSHLITFVISQSNNTVLVY